jgi:hypothetical protein
MTLSSYDDDVVSIRVLNFECDGTISVVVRVVSVDDGLRVDETGKQAEET